MNTRFLKSLLVVFVLMLSVTSNSQRSQKKMNVVLFLVDDLGWKDISSYGSDFYETPNIDQLASQGVRFTDAYAACQVCSPTRASILSGKYPGRSGLSDWLPGRKDFPFQRFLNVRSVQQLSYEDSTLAETLKANGYRTAIFGKWHLGEDPSNPLAHGFEERLSEWNKGWPNQTYFSPYGMPGLQDGPKGEYLTDRVTTEALKYIEKNKDKPFFMYLSHFAVHDPIQGRPDLVEKYRKKLAQMKKPSGAPFILEGNPDDPQPLSRSQLDNLLNDPQYAGYSVLPQHTVKIKQFQDNIQFAAMVESMDESMGRVMNKLKELGIDQNTIIIFASDNGGMSAANIGNPYRVIRPNALDGAFASSNLPLRAGKGWLYEGGIRVPTIIKWPGQGQISKESHVPIISTDFYPTILDMLGLPLLPEQHKDGVSITPLLKGKEAINRKAIFWHFPHYSNHGMQSPGGAVRYGDYKLIEYYENNTVQLFNLVNDIGEQNDIAKQEPQKANELRAMLHQWRKSVNAKMLAPNPGFSPDSSAGPRIVKKATADHSAIQYKALPTAQANGLLGERISLWRNKRLWYVAKAPFLLQGFESRPGEHIWQGEHAGKWIHAATLACENTKDQKLQKQLSTTAQRLIATQLKNGYMGTYAPAMQFFNVPGDTKSWDVWTHRYNLYGLLVYDQYYPNEKVLDACKKMGDLLIATFGEDKADITKNGTRHGMSTSTLLESIVMLYQRTKEKKYLDFAEYIVSASEKNPDLHLMGAMLANESVAKPGDGKAYQLMANLLGYYRLYQCTGNQRYLQTVMNGWNQIRSRHVLTTGGPWTRKASYNANKECFAHTDVFNPYEIVVENCCTVTWIQLNLMLFENTGQAVFFTEAETALYNQLLGGQYTDGIDWCYYTKPNEAAPPYESVIHCCASSGPRALELFARYLVGTTDQQLYINSLSPSAISLPVSLGGGQLMIKGSYPTGTTTNITLNIAQPKTFPVAFRIPANSTLKSVKRNGKAISATLSDKGYHIVKGTWKKGDVITIDLNFELNVALQEGEKGSKWVAFSYGPLALAQKINAKPSEEPFAGLEPDDTRIKEILQRLKPNPTQNGISFNINNSAVSLIPYYQAGSRTSGPRTYFQIGNPL